MKKYYLGIKHLLFAHYLEQQLIMRGYLYGNLFLIILTSIQKDSESQPKYKLVELKEHDIIGVL